MLIHKVIISLIIQGEQQSAQLELDIPLITIVTVKYPARLTVIKYGYQSLDLPFSSIIRKACLDAMRYNEERIKELKG